MPSTTTSRASVSSLVERYRALRGDLLPGKISDAEFCSALGTTAAEVVDLGAEVLAHGAESRDEDLTYFGLYIGFRFAFSSDSLALLHRLLGETWHMEHDNIVRALEELRAPASIDPLARVAREGVSRLDEDDNASLARNAIWALGKIGTTSAVERLGELARSEDPERARPAAMQLTRLYVEAELPSTREQAERLLSRPELVCHVLHAARRNLGREELALGLALGTRLGFDAACAPELSELVEADFHDRQQDVRDALARSTGGGSST